MLAKLQEKNRIYKRLAENAEEMATANLARLRRAQVSNDKYKVITLGRIFLTDLSENEDPHLINLRLTEA